MVYCSVCSDGDVDRGVMFGVVVLIMMVCMVFGVTTWFGSITNIDV